MANKELTLEERYANFSNEAETIKDELCDARKSSTNTIDIINRLEQLVNKAFEDSQLRNTDFWWGPLSRLEGAIRAFKKEELSLDDLIEYVWVAFEMAEGYRLKEIEQKETEKSAADIRTFCLESAKNPTYPEKAQKFFEQCAEKADVLAKIVNIN